LGNDRLLLDGRAWKQHPSAWATAVCGSLQTEHNILRQTLDADFKTYWSAVLQLPQVKLLANRSIALFTDSHNGAMMEN